eukprot:g3541.t1
MQPPNFDRATWHGLPEGERMEGERMATVHRISGLASENGKLLNGQRGLLCEFLEATGRWQVRIGEKLVSLKPIFGLNSDAGKALNGQKGVVTEYEADKDRWEVMISLEKVVSLRPRNLRRSKPLPGAVMPGRPVNGPKKTEGSLASLLGMGKPKDESNHVEAAKSAQWQSVWARTSAEVRESSVPPAAAMSAEQISYLQGFQNENEKAELKRRRRESKIRRELVMQGITDEERYDREKQKWRII